MAQTNLCSISVPFLILLMIAFNFSAQITPVSAGLSFSLKYAKISENEKIGSHAKSTSSTPAWQTTTSSSSSSARWSLTVCYLIPATLQKII
ncbi:hypothetical protein JHK85_018495 [Glycine max]|uniref:Transmembrane protein n=1 Tax=Glycine soja TaxID=3848 RepID=A0A0B2SJY6_GLYSO|nr:hypothetical protein JHK85_018495 [Glycine max]KHN44594.1 hypothetical protein glysoja_027205 [Glycine soja]